MLFAEFLATAGVFDHWVRVCPLRYSSPNASSARDVLGTLMLGILEGSKRHAPIAGVRVDAVAAKALGMQGMASENSVRPALKAIEPEASEPWMRQALISNVRDALDRPWVLDMDAKIKPLYGRQQGAEVNFNQWGWGGFTTQDMHRIQTTARAVALVYNWWSWYVRAANPNARREARTSRPLLLAAVGRATSSDNQATLYLTPMHAEVGLIKSMIANVHAAIRHVRQAAE